MVNVPIRTCAGCRTRRAQNELVRVSRRTDGTISVDEGGSRRSPGRGAYVCLDAGCVQAALRSGRLRRALRLETELPKDLGARLARSIEGDREVEKGEDAADV
jgi:predicted RNA-binding protein YlxR (DUF448 family)